MKDFFLLAVILRGFLLTSYGFNELVYYLTEARVPAGQSAPGTRGVLAPVVEGEGHAPSAAG